MRKYLQYILFVIAIIFCGCVPKKITVILPCEIESTDDALYIRELGHGVSPNLQLARTSAIHDAQFKIYNRLCDSIRTYMPQVAYNSNRDSLLVGSSDSIIYRYPLTYFGELSYSRKECEKVTYDSNNQYHCFITLALPKTDIEQANHKVYIDYSNYIVNQSPK